MIDRRKSLRLIRKKSHEVASMYEEDIIYKVHMCDKF